MDFRNIQEKIGFNVHKIAVWPDRSMKKFTAWGSWLSASAPNIQTPYEGILISYKNSWKKLDKGESTINKEMFIQGVSGIWDLGTTTGLTKANFPESLPKMCIELLTYKGDLVVDPFMGSGTTAKAAIGSGRNYIGFEISPNYTEVANHRIGADVEKLW
jgi:site-specific DNA-methyltransferase (adenine-specific)